MFEILQREFIYVWGYFDIQLRQILWYWIFGMLIGSVVSVFVKGWIHTTAVRLGQRMPGWLGLIAASALGVASPLCMYGTIPVCAAFSRKGLRDDYLAAFMMSSILLNPQLIIYSAALGWFLLTIRILSAFLCGIAAGGLVRLFFIKRSKTYFSFDRFDEPKSRDTDENLCKRLLFNFGRNIKATAPWFLLGVLLSALFQRYVPPEAVSRLFGKGNEGFGLLMAATVGVPLYVCGGGTIPLMLQWLSDGMSNGSAAAFMITGPATKITNLGALKIVLGAKNFALYIAFVMLFSLVTGAIVNFITL